MYSSINNLITVNIGTAKNIPNTPKYAPPTVTEKITKSGLIDNDPPIIFGLIILASICCNIITTIAITIAWPIPPVKIVISMATVTAIIAPKYGIKLNSPIKNPNKTEYLTPITDIAIDVKIPTTLF